MIYSRLDKIVRCMGAVTLWDALTSTAVPLYFDIIIHCRVRCGRTRIIGSKKEITSLIDFLISFLKKVFACRAN